MANIPGVQQSATLTLLIGMPGDWAGAPEQYLPTQGFIADVGGVIIGNVCWGVDGTNLVTNAKGSNTQLAGVVMRRSSTVKWNTDDVDTNLVIDESRSPEVCRNGTFMVKVAIVAGSLAVGKALFVHDTDGSFAVGVTVEPNYTATDYIVTETTGSANDICVISNTQTFTGASIL